MGRSRYNAGDIVVVPFPVPGRNPASLSIAIILLSWPFGPRAYHYLLCFVDPESSSDPYQMRIGAADLIAGELNQDVFIRPTYVMTVSESRIENQLGRLSPGTLRCVIDELADALYEDLEEQ